MLDSNIRSSQCLNAFRNKIPKPIRTKANSFIKFLNPKRVKLILKSQLGLSRLRDHKLKHGLQDCLNPICSFAVEFGTAVYYLLHCSNNLYQRKSILGNINPVLLNIVEQCESFIDNDLLFGDTFLDGSFNTIILSATIKYIT